MAALKCPNPSCPFQFDPQSVPAGALVTCPLCTLRFTLGRPIAPAPPPLELVDEAPAPSILQSRAFVVSAFIAFLLVMATALIVSFRKPLAPLAAVNRTERLFQDINLAVPHPDGWDNDDATRKFARVNALGLKKVESSARVAIAAASYRTRNAQPRELEAGLITERLSAMFGNVIVSQGAGTWLGQPALAATFRGNGPEGEQSGEACAVALHGTAYYFLAWSLTSDWSEVKEELAAIRDGCRLLNANPEWTATDSGTATFTGKAAAYRLTDGDQWWKPKDPRDEDPQADMLLKAKFKSASGGDLAAQAIAVTYVFPAGAADPLGTLREHVKAKHAKHFNVKTWHELTDDPQGDPPISDVASSGTVARYHAESDDGNTSKLVVLKAIPHGSGAIGIEVYCPYTDRKIWEKRLMSLAGSLAE